MNDIDLNKRLLEACGAGISDVSDGTSESHSYKKEFSTQTGSVVVDASAQSVDELKLLLQKVGITLPGGEPAKQVLTNIIRDKLKAYLMNGSK